MTVLGGINYGRCVIALTGPSRSVRGLYGWFPDGTGERCAWR